MSATKARLAHRTRLHRGSWGKPRVEVWRPVVSHHKPIEVQRAAQAVAASEFLDDLSERLGNEFGIRETTVKAVAVTALLLREGPADDEDEGEPEPKQMRCCGHRIGGGRLI